MGYNKSNGYVTINVQDFLNSSKVFDGDRSVFPLPGRLPGLIVKREARLRLYECKAGLGEKADIPAAID